MAIIVGGIAKNDVYLDFQNNYNTDDNSFYKHNNWVKKIPLSNSLGYTPAIPDDNNRIQSHKGAIWLTANGELYYRFSPLGKVHTAPIAKINLVFSNFLNCNFQITHTVPNNGDLSEEINKLNNENKLTISIDQLLLVEAEEFNPYKEEEFYQNSNDKLIYRNTFKPSCFLQLTPSLPKKESVEMHKQGEAKPFSASVMQNELQKSITLQYIYYLCGYNTPRFNYLINWLASFFKNLSKRSDTVLVLYGDSYSGIDILFKHIITPLFGKEYTLNITDNALKNKNISKSINEKLFYNLNNISKIATEKEPIRTFLQNLFPDRQKYAQTIITTEESEISYIDQNFKNYTVFQVSNMIDTMYIPKWCNFNEAKLTKPKLIDAINKDLENFAKILKLYSSDESNNLPFQDDDKKLIVSTLEEKLKAFVYAIKNIDIAYFKPIQTENYNLYTELQEDFNKHLIKQLNLIKYFNILYLDNKFESSRTFMKQLRKIDDDFFKATNAKAYSAGKKYFHIPTKS